MRLMDHAEALLDVCWREKGGRLVSIDLMSKAFSLGKNSYWRMVSRGKVSCRGCFHPVSEKTCGRCGLLALIDRFAAK